MTFSMTINLRPFTSIHVTGNYTRFLVKSAAQLIKITHQLSSVSAKNSKVNYFLINITISTSSDPEKIIDYRVRYRK